MAAPPDPAPPWPGEGPQPLPAGTRLGDVTVHQVLHIGESGIVYLGSDLAGEAVAVKEYLPRRLARRDEGLPVLPRSAADAPAFASGLQEFVEQSRRHDVQTAHGTAYRTMPLVRGRSLAEILGDRDWPLSADALRGLLERLRAGLEAMQRAGLVRPAISLQGIVIDADGSPVAPGTGTTPPALEPFSPFPSYSPVAPGSAPSARVPEGEPARSLRSIFGALLDGTFGVSPAARPQPAAAAPDTAEPLLFGLTAPRQAARGAEFIVSFAAYVESRRQQALKRSRALVGPDARQVADMPADGNAMWRPGTPFSVHLSGRSFEVSQPDQHFRWNGSHHVLGFAVLMDPTAQVSAVLTAMVMVEGIVVASVPVQIGVAEPMFARHVADAEPALAIRPAPSSAFASYASADAAQVAGRLSSLTRHAPDLRIFQDCLDLAPGESYKPRLRHEIAARDVFWLFWSRQAAASAWVRWELDTALACKDADEIVPMPLEDPALAPPPEPLAHQHFRDRFMIAGLGLARLAGRDHHV